MLSLAVSPLSFSGAPVLRATRSPSVTMAVEDLVGGINDPIFGGTPEGVIFDPLGFGQDEGSLYRRRCVEIKHGRVCMLAYLGMTVGPNEVLSLSPGHPASRHNRPRAPLACRLLSTDPYSLPSPLPQLFVPSHQLLSPSLDLHFDEIPGGIAAIDAVPAAGWAQILVVVGLHELTIAKQDYTKEPGEVSTFLGFKPEDPEVFREKQLKELKNGRLAMIAVLGELFAQQVSGMGTYEQLGSIINSGIDLSAIELPSIGLPAIELPF
jgi:light-harvesting complex I chlorophyll a/b binding protein 1